MGSLQDLLKNDAFHTAVLYGGIATLVAGVLALVVRDGPRRNPWGGLAFVVAGLAALDHEKMLPDDLPLAVAAVAAGAFLVALTCRLSISFGWRVLLHVAATTPGAVLVAQVLDVSLPGWIATTLVPVVALGGALVSEFGRSPSSTPAEPPPSPGLPGSAGWTGSTSGHGSVGGIDSVGGIGSAAPPGSVGGLGWSLAGIGPALWAVTVFGVWVTVPETQHVVPLIGAAVPIVLLGLPWPRPLASLGRVGASASVALLAWGIAVDGFNRNGAVIGAFACLGVLAIEPVVRRLADVDDFPWPVVVAVHLGVVGVCSRVAGASDSATLAFAFSAVAYVGGAIALTRFATRTGRSVART